jgi:hypothetical protein
MGLSFRGLTQVQINNPAELDHSTNLTHTGPKPFHQVGGLLKLA